MASSIAAMTMPRSIDFSRATASAICKSSSLLALTAIAPSPSLGSLGCGPSGLLAGLEPSLFRFCLARVALGGFFGAQRLCHQFVGEHQLGVAHISNRQADFCFAAFGVFQSQLRSLAVDAAQNAAEAFA